MIDRIAIMFPGKSFPIDKLEGLVIRHNGTSSGYFHGLRINNNLDGCSIRGSIPKYLGGSNVIALNRPMLESAFNKLEDDTGLEMKQGQVYKLEIGDTLPVSRPPCEYMRHWGKYGRYKVDRIDDGNSVYLRTKSRVFVGYDKGKEISPDKLPECFGDSYGLRLEWRIHRGMKKMLGCFPSPFQLSERDMYYSLIQKWQEAYFKIPKEPRLYIDTSDMVPSDFLKALAIHGLNNIGLSNLESFIDAGKRKGDIHKRNVSRIKSLVSELLDSKKLTIDNNLTEEVDSLVRGYT